jgi:hypothetical protein
MSHRRNRNQRCQNGASAPRSGTETITAHSSPAAVALRLVLAHLSADEHKRALVVGDLLRGSFANALSVIAALAGMTAAELTANYGEAGAIGVCAKRLGELAPTSDEPKTATG